MTIHMNWKDILISINHQRVPPFTFDLDELSPAERIAIEADRQMQLAQQNHWDELNDTSFPASDAMARY